MNNKPTDEIKIAIVDDHPTVREAMFTCLTLWGYSVIIQACNGQDLLNKVSPDNLPDICIIDLNMPVLNGYETIPILQKTWPSIKIMVFSMNITSETPIGFLNADATISKSGGLSDIKLALRRLHTHITAPQ